MAQLSGTYDSYKAVGQREDLSDVISMISPEDTPFWSNGQGEGGAPTATIFDWQTDTLAAAVTTNAVVEGDEASFSAPTPTKRIQNVTQISTKTASVTGTLEEVSKAGRKSELAREMAKRLAELKLDIEAAALSNQGAVVGDSATARKAASIQAFLFTNTVFESAGSDPVYDHLPTSGRVDGTQDAFVEADLQSGMLQAYNSGGKPTIAMMGPFNKQVFSTFDGISEHRTAANDASQTVIVGAADVYVSDFGNLTAVPNRVLGNIRGRDAFLLTPSMYSIVFLRPTFTKPLGDSGDSTKRLIVAEWSLRMNNEAAHAGLYDLTVS